MSFMEPEIYEDMWLRVSDGVEEHWTPVFPGHPYTVVERRRGWGARLSASGYMDATDWCVYDTEAEAREDLAAMYDLCPECLSEDECSCFDAARALREVVEDGRGPEEGDTQGA